MVSSLFYWPVAKVPHGPCPASGFLLLKVCVWPNGVGVSPFSLTD
jgi:hypothetical protein